MPIRFTIDREGIFGSLVMEQLVILLVFVEDEAREDSSMSDEKRKYE